MLKEAIDNYEISIVKHDNVFWLESRGAEDAIQKLAINETKELFSDLVYLGDIGKESKMIKEQNIHDFVNNYISEYISDVPVTRPEKKEKLISELSGDYVSYRSQNTALTYPNNSAQKQILEDNIEMWLNTPAVQETIKEYSDVYGSNKAFDALVNSDSWEDRLKAANEGYGLDVLLNDEDRIIRASVAEQGYGLDKLIYDSEPLVRASAVYTLVFDDDARNRFIANADDIEKDKAISVITDYQKSSIALEILPSYLQNTNTLKMLNELSALYEKADKLNVLAYNFQNNEDNKRVYGDNFENELSSRFTAPYNDTCNEIENTRKALENELNVTVDKESLKRLKTFYEKSEYLFDKEIGKILELTRLSENELMSNPDTYTQYDIAAMKQYINATKDISASIEDPSKVKSRTYQDEYMDMHQEYFDDMKDEAASMMTQDEPDTDEIKDAYTDMHQEYFDDMKDEAESARAWEELEAKSEQPNPWETYYQSKENGHLLSYDEMLKEAAELYDLDDPTNSLEWSEYYEKVEQPSLEEYKSYFEELLEQSGHKLEREKDGSIYLVSYPEDEKVLNEPMESLSSVISALDTYIQNDIINAIYEEAEYDCNISSISGAIQYLDSHSDVFENMRSDYDTLLFLEAVEKNPRLIDIQSYFHDSGKDYPDVDVVVYRDNKCDPPFLEEGAGKRLNKLFTPVVTVYDDETDTMTYSTKETFDTRQAAIQMGRELMASGAIEGFSIYNEITGEVEYSEGNTDIDSVLEVCGGYVDIDKINFNTAIAKKEKNNDIER